MLWHKTSDPSTVLHLTSIPAYDEYKSNIAMGKRSCSSSSFCQPSLTKKTNKTHSQEPKIYITAKSSEVQNDQYIQDYTEIFKMPALL